MATSNQQLIVQRLIMNKLQNCRLLNSSTPHQQDDPIRFDDIAEERHGQGRMVLQKPDGLQPPVARCTDHRDTTLPTTGHLGDS